MAPRPVSLARCYGCPVSDLGTFSGLHERGHQLAAHCPGCDRWCTLPLGELIAQGRGLRGLPLRVRRRDCGAVGQLHVCRPEECGGEGENRTPDLGVMNPSL